MALDPSYFFYSEGTITLTNGSDIATGDLVAWDPAVLPFDFVFPRNGSDGMTVIKEVLAVNQIRLAKPWTGPTLTGVPYFMVRWANHIDPRFYAVRVSDYLARLKAIPDNLDEVAAGISEDAAAVAAALGSINAAVAAVEDDREEVASNLQASQTAAGTATTKADEAAASAAAAATYDPASHLAKANNLSDLPDKAAARVNLGVPQKFYREIDLTAPLAAIYQTFPADVDFIRITGAVLHADPGVGMYCRISFDGTTYPATPDTYSLSYLLNYLSAGTPTFTYASGVPTSAFQLTVGLNNDIHHIVDTLLTRGGSSLRSLAQNKGTGFSSTAGLQNYIFSGFAPGGLAQGFVLYPGTGSFAAGTRLVMEGF